MDSDINNLANRFLNLNVDIQLEQQMFERVILYDFTQLSFLYKTIIIDPLSFNFIFDSSPELEVYITSSMIEKIKKYLEHSDCVDLLQKTILNTFPDIPIERDIIIQLLESYYEIYTDN